LPGFEANYDTICEEFKVDEIYVSSVNDGFVMNAWADFLDINNVKVIPDGNGDLAESLGMLVDMRSLGFGTRSRRFAVVLQDGVVVKDFVEPEPTADNLDPYGETSPENVINYLKEEYGS
jgi:peroxiredoxin